MGLKEAIAAGPKWDPVPAPASVKLVLCATACSLVPTTDRDTGLCLVCWRAWRFSQATTPVRGPLVSSERIEIMIPPGPKPDA
jgi:hypothetical protein